MTIEQEHKAKDLFDFVYEGIQPDIQNVKLPLQDYDISSFKGIKKEFNPKWKGWQETTTENLKDRVLQFYKSKYYDKMCLDKIPREIAIVLLDSAIRNGTKRNVKNLQKVLNLYYYNLTNVKGVLEINGDMTQKVLDILSIVLENNTAKEIGYSLVLERLDDIIEAKEYAEGVCGVVNGWNLYEEDVIRIRTLYNWQRVM